MNYLNNFNRFLLPFICLIVSCFATKAWAAPASTTFQVTATIASSCTVTAANLAFGNYTGAVLDNSSIITVNCTNSTAYNIGLGAGTGTGATTTTRILTSGANNSAPGANTLTSGTNHLNYTLWRDSARSLNWGNTVGTDTLASTGTGAAQTFTVYGRIPASQSLNPGSYSDTITVTVSF